MPLDYDDYSECKHGHSYSCEQCDREKAAQEHHARVVARAKAAREIVNLPNVPIKRMDRSNVLERKPQPR